MERLCFDISQARGIVDLRPWRPHRRGRISRSNERDISDRLTPRMACERWLGIDFSGNADMWTRGCSRSNVWIADVRRESRGLLLHSLMRVQQLPGSEPPFDRLLSLLACGDFRAAGIDAPFSLPAEFVQRIGGHDELLDLVGANIPTDRPFQRAAAFVELVTGLPPPLNPKKPLRETEKWWQRLRVNVRSTLWVKPRGGAPMTAACLSLLHGANRPLWPWSSDQSGMLAEAFPAGQLQAWNLPFTGYNGPTASAGRQADKDRPVSFATHSARCLVRSTEGVSGRSRRSPVCARGHLPARPLRPYIHSSAA